MCTEFKANDWVNFNINNSQSKTSYRRDGVDGLGQIQPCLMYHRYIQQNLKLNIGVWTQVYTFLTVSDLVTRLRSFIDKKGLVIPRLMELLRKAYMVCQVKITAETCIFLLLNELLTCKWFLQA